jgi:hypothetical protein
LPAAACDCFNCVHCLEQAWFMCRVMQEAAATHHRPGGCHSLIAPLSGLLQVCSCSIEIFISLLTSRCRGGGVQGAIGHRQPQCLEPLGGEGPEAGGHCAGDLCIGGRVLDGALMHTCDGWVGE